MQKTVHRLAVVQIEIVDGVRGVADEFYPRPVRVRTLDAPTDEFRQLEGGDDEPNEHNPMLGYRGIRRSLDQPETFAYELQAFRRLYDMGYDNVEIMFPLVNDAEDVHRAVQLMRGQGIDPDRRTWGVMVETPASALGIESLAEAGIDFASFGTNDLTQYTLATDRGNDMVAELYDELHPAVLALISEIVEAGLYHGVPVSVCGEMASNPMATPVLLGMGVTELSASPTYLPEVKRIVRSLRMDKARELADCALSARSTTEVHRLLETWIKKHTDGIVDRSNRFRRSNSP